MFILELGFTEGCVVYGCIIITDDQSIDYSTIVTIVSVRTIITSSTVSNGDGDAAYVVMLGAAGDLDGMRVELYTEEGVRDHSSALLTARRSNEDGRDGLMDKSR